MKLLHKRRSSCCRLSLLRTRDAWSLASARRWDDLRVELSTDRGMRQASAAVDLTGHNLLHTVVSCDPPIELVELLVRLNPAALANGGMTQTLPIHAAVANGASLDTVRALILGAARTGANADVAEGSVTVARDSLGRTPLHLAVRTACDDCASGGEVGGAVDEADAAKRKQEARARRIESLAVLSYLCQNTPELVSEPDDSGESPLDIGLSQGRGGRNGPVASVLLEQMRNTTRWRPATAATAATESSVISELKVRRLSTYSSLDVDNHGKLSCLAVMDKVDNSSNGWHDMNQLKELMDWTRRQNRYRSLSVASHGHLYQPKISRTPAA